MSKYVDYSTLKTLNDVRMHRLRINNEIIRKENALGEDYDQVKEMMTLNYWIDELLVRFTSVASVFQAVYSGYRFVASMFGGRSKKRSRKTETAVKKRRRQSIAG